MDNLQFCSTTEGTENHRGPQRALGRQVTLSEAITEPIGRGNSPPAACLALSEDPTLLPISKRVDGLRLTSTFADDMKAIRAYVVSYPVVLPLAFLATWLAGRASLGYWPRPSRDDPKYMGRLVDVPYTITWLLMIVGLPVFTVGVLSLLYYAFRDQTPRRGLLIASALSLLCMIGTIALLRLDPLGIVSWYMD